MLSGREEKYLLDVVELCPTSYARDDVIGWGVNVPSSHEEGLIVYPQGGQSGEITFGMVVGESLSVSPVEVFAGLVALVIEDREMSIGQSLGATDTNGRLLRAVLAEIVVWAELTPVVRRLVGPERLWTRQVGLVECLSLGVHRSNVVAVVRTC